jgi:hypothetical protein
MGVSIRTNGHWREPVAFCELPEAVKADFDYVSGDDILTDRFICYRGHWYDTAEFCRIHAMGEHDPHALRPEAGSPLDAWAGYQCDSFSAGIVIRYDADCERIQIGTYCG